MSPKSWHLDRRTFLRGTGVALALPLPEAMSWAGGPVVERPRRLCCTFFANGVDIPGEDHEHHRDWHWFPLGEGRDYTLTKSLDPFRDGMMIVGGMSHHHGLSHAGGKPGMENWGRYNRFLSQRFAELLNRLDEIEEGDSDLLDHSLCLYGSATSSLHLAENYPTVLAGGDRLGFQHGRFVKYSEETPMANLLATMHRPLGVEEDRFADSTALVSDLVG